MLQIGQGIACPYFFKSNCHANITGFDLLKRVSFVGVHLEDTGKTFPFVRIDIQHHFSFFDRPE